MPPQEPQKHRIRILRRTPITTSPRPGEVVTTLAISYQADDRPVRTIWIDKEEWSEPAEKAMIKKDIEARAQQGVVQEYEV